jgi:hypothetical protein
VFKAYAEVDTTSAAARKATSTMNVMECQQARRSLSMLTALRSCCTEERCLRPALGLTRLTRLPRVPLLPRLTRLTRLPYCPLAALAQMHSSAPQLLHLPHSGSLP